MQRRASSPRVALSDELAHSAFSVRDGSGAGLGRGRMLGADLLRPYAGARIRNHGADLTLLERCRAYRARAPAAHFFSHATAALLWGAPLPRRLEEREEIDVAALHPHGRPRARGVLGHRLLDGQVQVTEVTGMPVCDPASMWCQLAGVLSFDDLVAVGDYLVRVPPFQDGGPPRPFLSLDSLRARAAARGGPGSRVLRAAAGAVREGADSRRETHLRLLLLGSGLPEPRLNQAVHDRDGVWLGRADMVFPAQNVIVEYNGDQHRTDQRQFDKDATRIESFRLAGYTVVEVRSSGLSTQPSETVARVARALID